jgi:hypothetical protein
VEPSLVQEKSKAPEMRTSKPTEKILFIETQFNRKIIPINRYVQLC